MKFKTLLLSAAIAVASPSFAVYRYVGGDVSSIPTMEEAGSQYKDENGQPIADVLPYFKKEGMNAMRVRLFVDPKNYTGPDPDPYACQDLDYILPLCKRIKETGFALMLDFHYSDTWADPAKQWTPKAWEGLSDSELVQKIYDYTKECLQALNDAGATPDFIQPGNEISYGMLWGPAGTSNPKKALMGHEENWQRFGNLLNSAIKACHEECPDAKIVLHTERVAQPNVLKNFYDQMKKLNVDYDIIGLSYYPHWHGKLTTLKTAIETMISSFPQKDIMIVETGASNKWDMGDTNTGYEQSDAGQNLFTKDLVALLRNYDKVTGLFWWWMEYNPKGTKLANWYNGALFDPDSGKVNTALKTLCSFADGNDAAVEGVFADDEDENLRWYDISGRPVDKIENPGLYISRKGKILVK